MGDHSQTPLVPAKAGTQMQPEPLVGFTWIPAFAGMSGGGRARPYSATAGVAAPDRAAAGGSVISRALRLKVR